MSMDNCYLTGHAEIDQQHRVLFRIIDDVNVGGSADIECDVQVALDLIKYVIQHFAYEEGQMERSGYPDRAIHREAHCQITVAVMGFKERILAGEDARAELAAFIDEWIRHHIGGYDCKLAAFLRGLPAA